MSAATSTLPDKMPPGPRGLPVFGSLLELRHDTHLAIDQLARRYGDICLLRFDNVPTVIISHPDILQEAFGRTELAYRWVSEIMDILSSQKDLALAPYGDRRRQMQRFANRELLSARNLDNVRERHIEGIVNGLVDQMVAMGEAGELVSPPAMVARSNSEMMFRAVFGRDEDSAGEFAQLRGTLLEHVNWVFSNATATNLADYITIGATHGRPGAPSQPPHRPTAFPGPSSCIRGARPRLCPGTRSKRACGLCTPKPAMTRASFRATTWYRLSISSW